MRKQLFFSIIFISLGLLFNNCSKNPVYPVTPEIAFGKFDKFSAEDLLVLTISFKDGDGDLGLEQDMNNPPYHEYNYIKDGSGNYIKYDENDPSLPPLSCKKYTEDSLRADFNINYNNFIIEIYTKEMNGTYTKVDDSNICTLDQRFPPLVPINDKGPIEGTLSFNFPTEIFFDYSGNTLKFKIFIIDRALNRSNVIETPDIVID